MECINFGGTPNLGNDIDSYLIDSFQMAILVSTQGEYGSEGEWGSFSPKSDPDSPRSLLLFDGNTHLMGYSVGVPEDVGGGAWRMQVTLCDYDFTELYEEQLAEFTADQDRLFQNYIAPEDLADSGAEWFLYGYNTGRGRRSGRTTASFTTCGARPHRPILRSSAGNWSGTVGALASA